MSAICILFTWALLHQAKMADIKAKLAEGTGQVHGSLSVKETGFPVSSTRRESESHTTAMKRDLQTAFPKVLSAPRSLHTEFQNNNTLRISWAPPQPCPGETNYTLVVNRVQSISSNLTFQRDRVINIPGCSNDQVVVDNLWSGWRYSLTLTAYTTLQSTSVQLSQLLTMPESPPGKVQHLRVLSVEGDYRKMQISWDYPSERQRHGLIVNFSLSYQSGHRRQILSCSIAECQCSNATSQFCRQLSVQPGVIYTIWVRANNQYSGARRTSNYTALIGGSGAECWELEGGNQIHRFRQQTAEYFFRMVNRRLLHSVGVTFLDPGTLRRDVEADRRHGGAPPSIAIAPSVVAFTSTSITYCALCLLNDTNGEITHFALVVCASEYCGEVNGSRWHSPDYLAEMSSWHQAKADNFRHMYSPTDEAWRNSTRALTDISRSDRLASTLVTFVLGQDDLCPLRPLSVHCNGPLPAGRSFRVFAVSCTVTSCTSSTLSERIQTVALEESFTLVHIVIGSFLGITATTVLAVIVIASNRQKQASKGSQRALAMQEFVNKFREWTSKPDSSSTLPAVLVKQFYELQLASPQHSQQAAMMPANKAKNRYINILPFDHSRVKLAQLGSDVSTDYINANYIPGYHSQQEFIATQGPLQTTVDDFWRMVWEQSSPVIVMLSALTEGRLSKVYKYFPDEGDLHKSCQYGMVTVSLEDSQQHEEYLVRIFTLAVGPSRQRVYQFCIQNWKDFDVNSIHILKIVKAVHQAIPADNKHPLIVHCSAGVGRTGTWIAIDFFMHYIRDQPLSAPVHVAQFLLRMRDCRANMVQCVEQYVFIHEIVEELVRLKMEAESHAERDLCTQPTNCDKMADNSQADKMADNSQADGQADGTTTAAMTFPQQE